MNSRQRRKCRRATAHDRQVLALADEPKQISFKHHVGTVQITMPKVSRDMERELIDTMNKIYIKQFKPLTISMEDGDADT